MMSTMQSVKPIRRPSAHRLRSGSVFAAPFLPAVLLVALWIWWTAADGGYFPQDWYPAALGVIALAVVVAIASGRYLPPGRSTRAALLLFAGFVGFAFLSLLWSESPGSAWEAADKLLLYLATAWCLALLPWRAGSATALLGAWSLGTAAVCGAALLAAPADNDLGGLDTVARLASPVGYTNATAALAWMAFFAALALSYRRGLPVWLQALFLAVATGLLEFGLIPQSRGAALALVVTLVLFVAFAPDRLRLLARLVALGGLLLLALDPILDVQLAADAQRGIAPALERATNRIGLTLPLAALMGLAIGAAERWAAASRSRARPLRLVIQSVLAVAALVAVGVATANAGAIANRASERWEALTTESFVDLTESEGTRFRTLDTQGRTDAWGVAIDLFEENPVVGLGAGNYDREYTARRDVLRHSRYVHSLWLRSLAEAGILGTILLLGLVAIGFAGAGAGMRRVDRGTGAVAIGCLGVCAFFVIHSAVDWLEEIPALAAPAFGLLFVALRVTSRPPVATVLPQPLTGRSAAPACLVGVLAVSAVVLPYLSTSWVNRAYDRFRSDLSGAYSDLRRAQEANPLSFRPLTAEGTIAIYAEDRARAREAFRRSLEVEENWYARLELGLLESERGRFGVAERQLRRALELNRRDVFVRRALRQVRRRERIDPVRFNQRLLEETRSGFTRPAS